MSPLRFAVRGLRRELRSGELRVLAAALLVAVAAVTSVAFFSDRVERALERQSGELIAADLLLSAHGPIPPAFTAEARRLGLRSTRSAQFRSVVLAGDATHLAEVKAVEAGYPLRGSVRLAERPWGPERPASGVPAPGQAWLDPRLMQLLHLARGGQLQLGRLHLRVAAALAYEPDRAGELFNIAPRLMINLADLPASGLIQPGSRIRYHLMLAGPAAQVARYQAWAKRRLGEEMQLQTARDARPQLRNALDRAGRFLGLAALVSVLLAGTAVATATHRYVRRRLDAAAVMRCLGAESRLVLAGYAWQILLVGLAAAVLGCVAGYVAQAGLAVILAGVFNGLLPAPGPTPVLTGLLTGLAMLAGFALPPLMALRDVPPLRVLRRELAPPPPRALAVYGAAVLAVLALTAWQVRDLRLTLYVAAAAAAAVVLLLAVAWLLVRAVGPLRRRGGVTWRFGLANLARHTGSSLLQVTAFGLGILALLLLSLVRNDLLHGWEASLPPDAPNRFLINVTPKQLPQLKRFFAGHGRPAPEFFPMVRGRLTAIDGRPVVPEAYADPHARRMARREFNLSWAAALPAANRLLAGSWWKPGEKGLSVEQGIADTLHIKLGDTLRFEVAGQVVQARVRSLRKVQWDSFKVNFFVLAAPGMLEGFPASYITSFYLAPERGELLTELVRRFPNVTMIDVDAVMQKVRSVIDRVNDAIRFVFAFTLLAGVAVLFAAIQATHDERMRDGAILRTLGASRRQVRLAQAGEFVAVGALAGLLAALVASVTAWVLAVRVLDVVYTFNPWVLLLGVAGGALGVGLAGWWGTRGVLARPPLGVLREL